MPREHKCLVDVPKIYRHNFIDTSMFAFVLGVTSALPSVSVDKAIQLFKHEYDLSEDTYSSDSARIKFSQMKDQFNKLV